MDWKENNDVKPNGSVLLYTKHGLAEGEYKGNGKWIQYRWSAILDDTEVLFWIGLNEIHKPIKTLEEIARRSSENDLNIGEEFYKEDYYISIEELHELI